MTCKPPHVHRLRFGCFEALMPGNPLKRKEPPPMFSSRGADRPISLLYRLPTWALAATCFLALSRIPMNAQATPNVAQKWRAGLKQVRRRPSWCRHRGRGWDAERSKIRAELWKLLGDLPSRPRTPNVEVTSREDRGGVPSGEVPVRQRRGLRGPGLPPSPKERARAVPSHPPIATGTRASTTSAREELFQAKHTPEAPRWPAFARRGYVVPSQ